jgi:hypothetical protein
MDEKSESCREAVATKMLGEHRVFEARVFEMAGIHASRSPFFAAYSAEVATKAGKVSARLSFPAEKITKTAFWPHTRKRSSLDYHSSIKQNMALWIKHSEVKRCIASVGAS